MEVGIRRVLSSFISDDTVLDLFVNRKTMPYWSKGLTHESINYKHNYEKYEFLGDSTLSISFNIFLRENKGIRDSQIANNLLNHYMSKVYQPTIARKIGLDKLLIINPDVKVSDDILEDIFESFFGIFTFICRKLWQSHPELIQSPVTYLVEFFTWFFSNISQMDLSKGEPINKNFFNEFYYFFSGECTQTRSSWYYNNKNQIFFFNPNFTYRISLYSKDLEKLTRNVLTKKGYLSEDQYIDDVAEIFKELGFDLEWLRHEKAKISFEEPYRTLAKVNGYTRFILQRNTKDSYDLLAQKADPKTKESITDVLLSFDSSVDIITLKNECMEYLSKLFE